ncbi:2Fe-2S iron-sulfur cluster-binding protein [Streptomyces sp. NPDC047981]|uniref:2Fe-2S iron-sulfur cluster-binding protein n=1 Tax=Streptomyces sp. NPDC047981 TaxID=3154610 RepID=UPI003430EE79
MSNEPNENQHGNGYAGGWEPIPQSEGYDGDATAFVHLPPEFMLDGVPLEAPGHGYVPPMIVPLTPLTPAAGTDPAATGQWVVHTPTAAEHVEPLPEHLAEPMPESLPESLTERDPQATAEWTFPDAAAAPTPGEPDPHATGQWNFTDSGSTGQWTIPVVAEGAEAFEESGEYTTSMLAQYASSAPATLPGGAPAPWAVQQPETAETAQAQAEEEPAAGPEDLPVEEHPAEEHRAEEHGAEAHGAEEHGAEEHGAGDHPLDDRPFEEHPGEERSAGDQSAGEHPAGEHPAGEHPAGEHPAEDHPAEEPVPAPSTGSSADSDEHPHISYVLRVNGADRPVTESWIGESLLYVLRERLGLAGAKDGCSQGECGACNVQVDGRLVASCLVPAATAAGSEVRTVEGLATDGEPSDVQRALARCGAVQCGYCVPGMAMTVHDLLEGNHAPTELETRQALCGNLCRCSGYRGVLDAVREVVAERETQAQAQAAASASASASASDEARIPHQIPHPHDGGMA